MKWAVTGPASSLGEAPRPCHIREMRLKFTTRTPQPRGCVVTPLNDANPPKARPQERPRERPRELGGPSGPEPTRYGEWGRKGHFVHFCTVPPRRPPTTRQPSARGRRERPGVGRRL